MKNKSIFKGAAAIAVGGALLLGGGGTLAWWNAADEAEIAGSINAGLLDIEATAGSWTDRAGKPIDITTYLAVPGDLLTYTQDAKVTLKGNKLAATLVATQSGNLGDFEPTSLRIHEPILTGGTVGPDGVVTLSANPEGSAQTVTASISFEFLSSVTGLTDVNANLDLGKVAFTLQQIPQAGLVPAVSTNQ